MKLQLELQLSPVANTYSALLAVIRPMLHALLYSVKTDLLYQAGGATKVSLEMLSALRRPHDGELGICFEYAVHDAIRRGDSMVIERVRDSLKMANVTGQELDSILFGAEKAGSRQIIDTASSILTAKSKLLYGGAGRPLLLKDYINDLGVAFRKKEARERLPSSIRGLWKADLFLGTRDADCWVGTSVKINASDLEGAQGLRIGIVPLRPGTQKDKPFKDEGKNLIVCPLRHDYDFMQIFYLSWRIVAQVMHAHCRMPSDAALPDPLERQIAKELVDRARVPVVDVIDVLKAQAQPTLLRSEDREALFEAQDREFAITSIVAPISRNT